MKAADVAAIAWLLMTMVCALCWLATAYSSSSCHWQDLHTPAQTVDKDYYVTDPDGFSHTVTVQITRPAHVDKVCQ